MSFGKVKTLTIMLGAAIAAFSASAAAQSTDLSEDEKSLTEQFAEQKEAEALKRRDEILAAFIKKNGARVKFERIVGYTSEGLPITDLQKKQTDMAFDMARKMREENAKLAAQGKAKKIEIRDPWAEREKEVNARLAKGPVTTEQFIVPGTTPEQSRAIHDDKAGFIASSGTGKTLGTYTVKDGQGETKAITQKRIVEGSWDSAIAKPAPEAAPAIVHTTTQETVNREHLPASVKNRIRSVKPKDFNAEEEMDKSAEERLKEFFPDQYSLLDWLIPEAYAADNPGFTADDLKAIRDKTDKLRKDPKEGKLAEGEALLKEMVRQKDLLLAKPGCDGLEEGGSCAIKPTNKKLDEALKLADLLRRQSPLMDTDILKKDDMPELALAPDAADPNALQYHRPITYIFISYSLDREVLRAMFDKNRGRDDVIFVMRGVPDGKGIADGIREMQELATEKEPVINCILDPTLFEAFGVKAVPTVVRAKGAIRDPLKDPAAKTAKPELIAKVEGLDNDEWLLRQIEHDEKGDLGQQGEIFEIAEPDMIKVMMARAAAIDWEAKKEAALKRVWTNQHFEPLAKAGETVTRELDPSIMVTQDMKDADGNIIHAAGTVINPLDIMPFTQVMMIFDPLDEEERKEIDRQRKTWEKEHPGAVISYLVTRIDRDKGWDSYKEITDWLDAPIYLLTPEVKSRWQLRVTPSIVTADNDKKVFLVEEIKTIKGDES